MLSAGHGSTLLYSLLHLTGYDLPMSTSSRSSGSGAVEDARAIPSRTLTPGVEATTGPLGQGTANAVGMAIAER